jgi:hypothetical protein
VRCQGHGGSIRCLNKHLIDRKRRCGIWVAMCGMCEHVCVSLCLCGMCEYVCVSLSAYVGCVSMCVCLSLRVWDV